MAVLLGGFFIDRVRVYAYNKERLSDHILMEILISGLFGPAFSSMAHLALISLAISIAFGVTAIVACGLVVFYSIKFFKKSYALEQELDRAFGRSR